MWHTLRHEWGSYLWNDNSVTTHLSQSQANSISIHSIPTALCRHVINDWYFIILICTETHKPQPKRSEFCIFGIWHIYNGIKRSKYVINDMNLSAKLLQEFPLLKQWYFMSKWLLTQRANEYFRWIARAREKKTHTHS